MSIHIRRNAEINKIELTTYRAGKVRNTAHRRELCSTAMQLRPLVKYGTKMLKFPPITTIATNTIAIDNIKNCRFTVSVPSSILPDSHSMLTLVDGTSLGIPACIAA